MKKTKAEPMPFWASAFSQAAYVGLCADTASYTAREGILAAGAAAVLLWLALVVLGAFGGWLRSHSAMAAGWRPVAGIALVAAAVQASCQLWAILFRQFRGGMLWVPVLVVLLLCLAPPRDALYRTAWAVRLLAAVAILLLIPGLFGQLRWQRLAPLALQPIGIRQAFGRMLWLCPELLWLPLDPAPTPRLRRLPLTVFLFQAATLLLCEMLFGYASAGRHGAGELLRAWSLGIFSRMDALWVGLWLVLTMLRLLLVGSLAASLYKKRREVPQERVEDKP